MVLLITLIMLVAMTLAGIALIRSVHTTSLIAGNMAFQQATVQSSNIGAEAAMRWLDANAPNAGLDQSNLTLGYSASRRVPQQGMSWRDYWHNVLSPAGVVTLTADSSGNTVQYVIDRLCNTSGPSTNGGCAMSPRSDASGGNSKGTGARNVEFSSANYYRIITRIQGPRSTESFVETVVSR